MCLYSRCVYKCIYRYITSICSRYDERHFKHCLQKVCICETPKMHVLGDMFCVILGEGGEGGRGYYIGT